MSPRHYAAALGAAAMVMVSAPLASADTGHISINVGSGWTHDAAAPLFDFSRIAPGWNQSVAIGVRNDSSEPSVLTLNSSSILDNENGCTHSERYVDSTCSGSNTGELGHELVLSVYPQVPGTQPLWSGDLYDLTSVVTLDRDVQPGQVDAFRIEAKLPTSSGNETQTDSVQFALRLTLSGSESSATTEVKGVRFSRNSGDGTLATLASHLPFTGSHAPRLIAGSMWMIVAGILLLLCVRVSRRTRGAA